jgi:fructokinase
MSGRPCIFGEVLFDQFPGGRRVLGGAPFNVAWHLQAFGQQPYFVSRVGDDADGASIRAAMQGWGMDTGGLQTDAQLPTGRVQVSIEEGEPAYEIVHPAAWDAIGRPASLPDLALLYHGSLALRDPASREALAAVREQAPPLVFVDVNLRSPWWSRQRVLEDLRGADWVKLNRHELEQLWPGDGAFRGRAQALMRELGAQGLIVTDGERGAALLTAGGEHLATRPARTMVVVDTVGAGDALASVMVLGLLRQWPLDVSLERAQYFASAIVGRRGATVNDPEFYARCIEHWSAASPGR